MNALVLAAGPEDEDRLLDCFQSEVLKGPAAFYILADGYEDVARAMTLKLQREGELPMISGHVAGADAG